MHSATLKVSGHKGIITRLQDVPTWAVWLAALAYVGIRSWFIGGVGVYGLFGDPDDATRLIEVRELMASWHWFDNTTMKIGGDAGMLSHWSRLIDLPLAGLIAVFHLFMPIEDAEKLTYVVWPLSLLGALMWVLLKAISAVTDEATGRNLLLLAALTPLGWYQFAVGRIDHHNVMIAATISATALMWAFPRRPDVWRAAGILTGLAVAVGYEALPPAVALGILAAAWALFDRRVEKGAAAFSLALSLTFAAAFFATIPPSRWMDIRCDAISLNMVVLVAAGVGGLLVVLGPGRDWTIAPRIGTMAACAGLGLFIFGWLEPKCLAGPMGQVPPILFEIWLNKVSESGSIVERFMHRDFDQPLALLLFYSAALTAQIFRLKRTRSAPDLFLLAMLAWIIGLACWQFKYVGYASFMSIIALAVAFGHLGSIGEIRAATAKLAAIVLLNQMSLTLFSQKVDAIAGAHGEEVRQAQEDASACEKPGAIHDLSELTPGLFASNIDLGAFIAANTNHRVLNAPYHRIADAIIANHEIFSAHDAKSAAAVLKQQNVDYVAICDGLDKPSLNDPKWKGTLKVDLVNGKAPSYLVPETLANPHSLYRVWKVDRAALNLLLSKAAASAQ